MPAGSQRSSGFLVTVYWRGGGAARLGADARVVQGAADVEAMIQELVDARWAEMEATQR